MKIFHIGLCVSPPPFNELQLSFIRHSTEYREISTGDKEVNKKAIQIAKEFNPDLIFMQIQSTGIINKETFIELQKHCKCIINWNGDVRDNIPQWMIEVAPYCISSFSNMRDVKVMKSLSYKAEYCEIGYNEHIYKPEGKVNKTNKIVFFGNNYGKNHFPMSEFRIEMVSLLKSRYHNSFSVYGTGWQNADGNFNHSQEEESAAYRGSQIAINCSHYEIEKYSSDRLLRILGTGVPICFAKWYPSLDEDFIDGIHLRVWRTLNELEKLINEYKGEATKLIIENGMKLAQEKFTFDKMVLNILGIYKNNT